MWDRWVGSSISLQALSESVNRFFEGKSLPSTVKEESKDVFTVIAILKGDSASRARVRVSIRGKPDDFVVDFAADSSSGTFRKISSLMTLFGGGFLLKKSFETEESLEELEREFWTFIDMTVESFKARKEKNA